MEDLQLVQRAEEDSAVPAAFLGQLKLQVQTITTESLLRAKKLLASLAVQFKRDFHRVAVHHFPLHFLLIVFGIDPLPRERFPGIEPRTVEQHDGVRRWCLPECRCWGAVQGNRRSSCGHEDAAQQKQTNKHAS